MKEEKAPFKTDTSVVSSELVQAAEMGFASAQWQVGDALYKAENYGQAFYWIDRAAQKGILPAMVALGYLYLNGLGTLVNEKRAFQWTAKAALKDDPVAQLNLGLQYFHGQGVDKNDNAALHWLRLSAEAGNHDAIRFVAFFYENGIAAEPSDDVAFKWYKKAADDGDIHAMVELGHCYEEGRGVAADPIVALDLYRRASDLGESKADLALGYLYLKGSGMISPDPKRASEYLQKASIEGEVEARRLYGEMLIKEGHDMIAAFFWIKLAADSGDRIARITLKRFGPDYTWALAESHMRNLYGYVIGPAQ
jgi:TPR repeat protein